MAVTIRDVAKAAGTSISTVSKVINRHYSISEATAARVRQVMEEMNYHPMASAQSFASGMTRKVAFLAALQRDVAFDNPHMFEMLCGLEEALQKRGYAVVLRSTDTTAVSALAEDIIARRECDALAIHASVLSRPLAALLSRARFPHVVLGQPGFACQISWIDVNNVYCGVLASEHLVSLGRQRVAFIGGGEHDLISAHRLEGVRQGLREASLPLEERYIWLGESTRDEGARMAGQLLGLRPLPDAIICANNALALGCVAAVQRRGLRIPRDIAIMTFDDHPFSALCDPPLSVVDIDVREMGAQAGKFLLSAIKKPNLQSQTHTATPNLIVRASTVESQA